MKDKHVILIVDNVPKNLELLEALLVPNGYEVVKATNGEDALGKLYANRIDLILLDVMMPEMDGFELTRRIRKERAHKLTPIILLTALQETEFIEKGIEAGCDDFITKPADKIKLLTKVQAFLKDK